MSTRTPFLHKATFTGTRDQELEYLLRGHYSTHYRKEAGLGLQCHHVLQWGWAGGQRGGCCCSCNNPGTGQALSTQVAGPRLGSRSSRNWEKESGKRASLLVPRAVSEHSTGLGRWSQWFLRFREIGKDTNSKGLRLCSQDIQKSHSWATQLSQKGGSCVNCFCCSQATTSYKGLTSFDSRTQSWASS